MPTPIQGNLLDQASDELSTRLRLTELVSSLTDDSKWSPSVNVSMRIAADAVLRQMVVLGLIERRDHPRGGDVWIISGQLFGRTDGLPPDFYTPPSTTPNRLHAA